MGFGPPEEALTMFLYRCLTVSQLTTDADSGRCEGLSLLFSN
jgi:hypothetical protein